LSRTHHPIPGLIVLVALISMIGPFTVDTYLPSFPAIEADFGISRALLSQSLAFYLAAFAISTLFWGPLSDRLGRKRVIVGTLLLYVLASLGCAQADDYSTFLFFRLLQGVAAGGGLAAGRTMIRDVYNPADAQKAMAQVMMMFAVAPAIAPIIGGWLQDAFGWHASFYFLAIFSGVMLLIVLFYIPETLATSLRQSFHPLYVTRVYVRTLTHRRFLSLIVIVAAGFGGMFLYIAGAPTVMFDFLGMDSHQFGWMFVPMVVGMICGSWVSSRLAHRWPPERTVKLALSLIALGAVCNLLQAWLLPPMLFFTVAPLVLYVSGIGMAMPVFTVLSLDCFPQNRGAASAMHGFVQMMGNAVVASVVVPLLAILPLYLAAGQVLLVLLALLLWWRIPPAR